MAELVHFLVKHGYIVLFAFVLAEQLGLPVPSVPVLVAAGALIGSRQFSLAPALGLAVIAAVSADLAWYELGRRRGPSVLGWICRISLEPDSCVRRTEDTFARHGAKALLFAKFVPGLSTAAPPLSGMSSMSVWKFLASDGAGSLLWSGAFIALGRVFSSELEHASTIALRLGAGLFVLLGGGLAAWIARKYIQRRRFLRDLRIARISPRELKEKFDAGENVFIVDLRRLADFTKIKGALHILPDDLEQRHAEIPRDRDIVLYCT